MNPITNFLQTIVSFFSQEDDSQEIRQLDKKLQSLCMEWRHSEEKNFPKLSNQFDSRLLHLLKSETPAPARSSFYFPVLIESRSFQYSLSFALALVLVFVVVFRIPSVEDSHIATQEKTSVIIDNSSYLNQPSSAVYSTQAPEGKVLYKIRDNSHSMDLLLDLENYYVQTGRVNTANEIHNLIDNLNNLPASDSFR